MKSLIQLAGLIQVVLSLLHIPIARYLNWKKDLENTPLLTRQVFFVHAFFIALFLMLVGLPSVIRPQLLLERSDLRLTVALCLAIFWACRLICQFFVYSPSHHKGKTFETIVHWVFAGLWTFLTATYTLVVLRHIAGH